MCFLGRTEKEPKNNSRYKLSATFQSLGSDSSASRAGADVLVFNVKIGFFLRGRDTKTKLPGWQNLPFITQNRSFLVVLESAAAGKFPAPGSQGEHCSAWPCLASGKFKIKGLWVISFQHIANLAWGEAGINCLVCLAPEGAMVPKCDTDEPTPGCSGDSGYL